MRELRIIVTEVAYFFGALLTPFVSRIEKCPNEKGEEAAMM
jgi:hypothetical protein